MAPLPARADPPTYFSEDGKQTTDFGDEDDEGSDVAIQADGKTVVVGSVTDGFGIARYDEDGSLDASFADDGRKRIHTPMGDFRGAVALQSDGKIVVAGGTLDSEVLVARFNSDGSLDASFADDGVQLTDLATDGASVAGIAIQSDGKIVVAGSAFVGGSGNRYMVARFTSDGRLDDTFGSGGAQLTDMGDGIGFAVALQSDDKIVVVGSTESSASEEFGAVRYTANGTIDDAFSGDGIETTDFGDGADKAEAVAVQPDGRIVVAGVASTAGGSYFAMARYDTDGTLDSSFSGNGIQVTKSTRTYLWGHALVLQSDNKIVVAGETGGNDQPSLFALARYKTDGTLDGTFAEGGMQTTEFGIYASAFAAAVGTDGKITLAGDTLRASEGPFGGDSMAFAIARYNPDGSLDARPDGPPPATEPEPAPASSRACTIIGTARGEVIHGTSGRDVICARGGSDVVYGHGGNDLVFGHRGNDRVYGGRGNDRVHGASGRDKLVGGPGSDLLRGGHQGDRLNTLDKVRGNDSAYGGYGNDSCATNRRDLRRNC